MLFSNKTNTVVLRETLCKVICEIIDLLRIILPGSVLLWQNLASIELPAAESTPIFAYLANRPEGLLEMDRFCAMFVS